MNIGDKVRLLRGREGGIVTRILPNDIIEVEIEDGFRIPVQRRELAAVSPEEAIRFKTPTSATPVAPKKEIIANEGVYLAWLPFNNTLLTLHLINNTDWQMPFTLVQGTEPHLRTLAAGMLAPRTEQKITELALPTIETWGIFTLSCLFARTAFMGHRTPLIKHFRPRPNHFTKEKLRVPVLGSVGYFFQMDEAPTVAINPEKIIEKITTPPPPKITSIVQPPAAVIDLHIEKINKDFMAMSASQIIDFQLITFEKSIENALVHGLGELTFIHGIGNGTLRDELHRRLGKNPNVAFFQDAQKEKFGYGATRVKLK